MHSSSVSRVAPVGVFTFTHWPKTMLPSFHKFQHFLNPEDHITNTDGKAVSAFRVLSVIRGASSVPAFLLPLSGNLCNL